MNYKPTTKAEIFSGQHAEITLRLFNEYGHAEKEYATIEQLTGDLERWWKVGLDWEPKAKGGER